MPPSKSVPEEDLELVPEDANPWRDLLEGRTEGVGVYQKLLTFERINRPPSRVAESFGTARAKLLPYQFKSLLKFLDSAKQRLLIADERLDRNSAGAQQGVHEVGGAPPSVSRPSTRVRQLQLAVTSTPTAAPKGATIAAGFSPLWSQ